ncbi:hypothetical protein TW86_20725 [Halomonas sp. S2151]|nr:hypothetical protein TW86_20725 [Halomonas sp. S2151]
MAAVVRLGVFSTATLLGLSRRAEVATPIVVVVIAIMVMIVIIVAMAVMVPIAIMPVVITVVIAVTVVVAVTMVVDDDQGLCTDPCGIVTASRKTHQHE